MVRTRLTSSGLSTGGSLSGSLMCQTAIISPKPNGQNQPMTRRPAFHPEGGRRTPLNSKTLPYSITSSVRAVRDSETSRPETEASETLQRFDDDVQEPR